MKSAGSCWENVTVSRFLSNKLNVDVAVDVDFDTGVQVHDLTNS